MSPPPGTSACTVQAQARTEIREVVSPCSRAEARREKRKNGIGKGKWDTMKDAKANRERDARTHNTSNSQQGGLTYVLQHRKKGDGEDDRRPPTR